eukprot:scaffold433746_cov34-Prasinocladus_malaysianus.AAC.1
MLCLEHLTRSLQRSSCTFMHCFRLAMLAVTMGQLDYLITWHGLRRRAFLAEQVRDGKHSLKPTDIHINKSALRRPNAVRSMLRLTSGFLSNYIQVSAQE